MNAKLIQAEKAVIISGAVFVLVYMLVIGDFSNLNSESFGGASPLLAFLASLAAFLGISISPYVLFYKLSGKIQAIATRPLFNRLSFALSVIIIVLCCCLYIAAGISIREDNSSSAAIVYAIMPVYYLLIGGALYWVLLCLATRDARSAGAKQT